WTNRDEAFADIVRGIQAIIEDMATHPYTPSTNRLVEHCQRAVPQITSVSLDSVSSTAELDVSSLSEKAAIPTNAEKVYIEIHLGGEIENLSDEVKVKFFDGIRTFLDLSTELRIKRIRHGSIKLTFELPADKAEELFRAIQAGQFATYGVLGAELNPE